MAEAMKKVLDPPFVHTTPRDTPHNVLHVVVLTTSFPLEPESSSGTFVARLFDHLPENVEATIITPASRRTVGPLKRGRLRILPVPYAPACCRLLAHEPGGLPVALRTQPWLYFILPMLLASLAIVLLKEARRSDSIHANWAVNGLLAGLIGRLLGRPVVVTLRGEDVTRARRGGLARRILAAALRLSTRAAAVSADMATWLKGEFPRLAEKIVLVANGVDSAFLEIDRPAAERPTAVCEFITVGSLIPRKGVDTLIRALAACEHRQWHFRVVGAGPEHEALSQLAESLGVGPRVTFMGNVPPSEVPALLSVADVFLLGSHAEGRPNSLVEAMAAGLPVLASRIDGVTELIDDGTAGLLAQPGNVAEWSESIEQLLASPALRKQLGEAARRRIMACGLTWQAAAEKYAEIYRSMVEN
jgi:glycosyltransferase involved in cell wall biosynthesis